MTRRTHWGVQSTRAAMARLRRPPRESSTMRAWRLLTALPRWRLRRCSFRCSEGRKDRTLTLSRDRLQIRWCWRITVWRLFYAPSRSRWPVQLNRAECETNRLETALALIGPEHPLVRRGIGPPRAGHFAL